MQKQSSLALSLASLPASERAKVLHQLSNQEAQSLLCDWSFWARPNQLPPEGDWLVWLFLAGRGTGKTRAAAEFVRSQVEQGKARRIALVGKTPADVRDVMIEGDSGLLNIGPEKLRPRYEPSKRRLVWPNGAIALTFSSHEPDQLRGPQHDLAWCDELRTFAYPQETWDNLMLGLRLGEHPRCVVTTTPSPISLIRYLVGQSTTAVTRGITYDNRGFLAPSFFSQIVARYAGTRLGRQEIEAELLEDLPGALWRRAMIRVKAAPDMRRVVVAIDPATTSGEGADETGIVVAGIGIDGAYYVLADRSARCSPDMWARRAVQAHQDFRGDRIIGETNNGGEMVELTLRTIDRNIPYTAVHASRGKQARAEPISALYEQEKVWHIQPFPELEDQLCMWSPESGESPDRLDALVWALTELSGGIPAAPVDDTGLQKSVVFSGLRGRAF